MPSDGQDRALGPRVAVAESRLQALEAEFARVRQRLHKIESDRAAVKLLAQQVTNVSETIKELAGSLETIAAHAAEQAVVKVLAAREEKARMSWRDRLQSAAVAVAVGGLLWAVVLELFR